ncbi:MAG: ANTAR domain-containing protein [Actinomycetes bacterium]
MAQELPFAASTDELATVFARMSGLLLSHETVDTALGAITSLAVETVPGTAGSGVTLLDAQGRKTTSGASDAVVERADALQYELDEGPCLSAWRERMVFRIDDVLTETRWALWTKAVIPLGVRSVLSAPMVSEDETLGAVKLYSRETFAYDNRAEHLLTMFASQAAVLIANVQSLESARRLSEQLKEALRSRDVIGMAKGILIAQDGIDETQAFAMLASVSQRENRKLRDVAETIVHSAMRRRRR